MARQEISKDISDLVSKGKMREAYAKFEELPLVDQVAISISPGVGDALAAYETFEFGKRSETEFKEGDILGGLGYAGLSGISAISILPLFRLLRGARPVKEVFTGTKTVPEVVEEVEEVPIKLEEPKVPKADIPKLPKLEDINIRSLQYPGTGGLISNTRRELYTGNYPDQMKMVTFINKIRNKVPDSELRALKVLTPEGDLHPEFIQRFGSINDKINIKGFDDYLDRNQRDVFKFFEELENPISPSTLRSDNAPFVGTQQNDIIYTSKFTDAHKGGRRSEHYNADYPNVFVFDSATKMAPDQINKSIRYNVADRLTQKMGLTQGKTLKKLTKDEKADYDALTQELDLLGLSKAEQDRAIARIVRNPEYDADLTVADNLDQILDSFDNKKLINFEIGKPVLNLNRIQSDYAEDVARLRTKLRRSDPKASPYEEPSVTKKVKELVNKYNDKVAEYNDYMIKGGLEAVPRNINDELSEIIVDDIPYGYKLNYTFPGNKEVKPAVNQMLRKAYDGYRKKIRKGDIKPQSFLRFIKNDQNLKNNASFDIKLDGQKKHILKPIRGFETSLYKMDPFATKGRAVVSKIVMRKRIEQAVRTGYGGIYMDSGRKVTSREGGAGQDIIETQYKEAESELKKIVRELGLNPDDVKVLDYEGGDELFRTGFGQTSGTYFPFSEEFRQAVLEKGINAFKKGGPINIQQSLDELNKKVLPNPPDVGSITPVTPFTKPLKPYDNYGDPVINKLKKAFKFVGDVKEFILPEPKASDPLSLIDYAVSSSPPGVVGKTAVKGLGKIDIDADDLEELVDWVKSSKNEYQKRGMQTLLGLNRNKDIKNVSKNYLKENNLINKDGTVTLYRYLNIAESNKLLPDKGLSSTTLNPAHAKEMAIKQSKVTGRKLKEGQKGSIFDSSDPFAADKYEVTTLYRKPVVLEYKVPVEKVEAYLPAVFNSIDEAGDGFNTLARMNVENSYSHLADDLVDEGYDYYDALDELKGNYGYDDIYDSIDAANLESEVLIDLTNIKPTNIYSDFSEVNQVVDLNILDRLKFVKGGVVNIQDMLDELNTNKEKQNKLRF